MTLLLAPFLLSFTVAAPSQSHTSGAAPFVRRDAPEYVAHFYEASVSYTSKETGASLELRMLSADRGDESISVSAPTVREERGDELRYHRQAITEVYELRPNGLKQSFVFASLPHGSGDLVVTVGVETNLALLSGSSDGLLFGAGDDPLVQIGAVLGIDGKGLQAKGRLEYSDGRVRMSLPAEFVANAALPLVLDPLIGGPGDVLSLVWSDALPPEIDVAHLRSTDQFYVTSELGGATPSGGLGVVGRQLDGDGTPLGTRKDYLDFSGGPYYARRARVAGVSSARRFLVGMIGGLFFNEDIWITSVDEFGNHSANTVGYSNIFSDVTTMDLGGETSPSHGHVIAALYDGQVRFLKIDPVALAVVDSTVLPAPPANTGVFDISVPQDGGSPGRYLVTWREWDFSNNRRTIVGTVIDRDLNILVSPFPITDGEEVDGAPSVDGNGTNWLVAFERGTGNGDVICRGVNFDAASGSVVLAAEEPVASDPTTAEFSPSVVWTGESYLVGHTEQYSGTDHDVFLTSLESLTCTPCEGKFTVYHPSTDDQPIRLASRGAGQDEALAVFAIDTGIAVPFGNQGLIRQSRFRSDDGIVQNLGGGCATGDASATCAVSGTTRFGVRLSGAQPLAPAILAASTRTLGFGCGPCTLVPDLEVLLPAATSANGVASVTAALPPSSVMVGTKLYAQWIVASPSTCPSFNVALSNALEITVQ